MKKIHASILTLAAFAAVSRAESPYAATLVSSTGLTGTGLYNDPNAVLGKPSTKFNNRTVANPEFRRVKLIEAPYNLGLNNEKLLTTINTGQSLTVAFDHDVTDDPNNPFGLDFNVFGNAFFAAGGGQLVNDATNLNNVSISGGSFDEPLKVSVSPDNLNWYTYDNGPYADSLMPTNAYKWDRSNAKWTDQEMDFTKPIDPSITRASLAGKSAADVLDLYNGSAGGVGFDLAPSGFSSIRYIRVTGVSGFAGGEIDGFADVAAVNPVPEPGSFAALGLGGLALLRRRRGGRA